MGLTIPSTQPSGNLLRRRQNRVGAAQSSPCLGKLLRKPRPAHQTEKHLRQASCRARDSKGRPQRMAQAAVSSPDLGLSPLNLSILSLIADNRRRSMFPIREGHAIDLTARRSACFLSELRKLQNRSGLMAVFLGLLFRGRGAYVQGDCACVPKGTAARLRSGFRPPEHQCSPPAVRS